VLDGWLWKNSGTGCNCQFYYSMSS